MKKKEYAEKFLDGFIRFNPLADYKEIEDGRKDVREGVAAVFQPKNIILSIAEKEIPTEDLADAITITYDNDIKKKCLCLSNNTFELSKKHSNGNISYDFKGITRYETEKFGKYIVLIYNRKKFLKKVIDYFNEENRNINYRKIKYVNMKTYHGEIEERGFVKDKAYKKECEFRILIDSHGEEGVKTIEIGNIRDFAMLIDYDALKSIKFKVKSK